MVCTIQQTIVLRVQFNKNSPQGPSCVQTVRRLGHLSQQPYPNIINQVKERLKEMIELLIEAKMVRNGLQTCFLCYTAGRFLRGLQQHLEVLQFFGISAFGFIFRSRRAQAGCAGTQYFTSWSVCQRSIQ